jgi:hypothetical protein
MKIIHPKVSSLHYMHYLDSTTELIVVTKSWLDQRHSVFHPFRCCIHSRYLRWDKDTLLTWTTNLSPLCCCEWAPLSDSRKYNWTRDFVLTTWIPLWLFYFPQLGFEDCKSRAGPILPLCKCFFYSTSFSLEQIRPWNLYSQLVYSKELAYSF